MKQHLFQPWALLSGAVLLSLVGLWSGWGALANGLGGVGFLLGVTAGALSPRWEFRGAVWGGLLASLVLVPVDRFLVQRGFLFFTRGAWILGEYTPAYALVRGIGLAWWLALVGTLDERIGRLWGTAAGAVLAGLLGWLTEAAGGRFWSWNAIQMPDAEWAGVWALVPVQWLGGGLLGWYYLMPFSRRVPIGFFPIGVGLRAAGGWIGWWLIAFGMLLRLYGRAGLG